MDKKAAKKQWLAVLLRILCAALILAAAGAYVHTQLKKTNEYTRQTFSPTCTDSGYTLYTNQLTGATEVRDVVPALGHDPGQAETVQEGTELEPEVCAYRCKRCDAEITQVSYPELALPRLSLDGDWDGIGKKQEVPLTAEFVSGDLQFSVPATAKHQGHSTLAFDKKNYTVKFYRDDDREEKYKIELHHWNPENKYILKANYQDPSQCKNLVCADIWASIVKSRQNPAPQLARTSNYGAVDGFPVVLYANHRFQGLYTMNLHKDDDLFAMEDGQHHAIMIVNHTDSDEAWFRAEAEFGEDTPWEVEFCGTEDPTWAKDRLNALIRFVNDSDDETFSRELHKHLDIDSAVDYFIAMYALGLQEHCAKDLILFTYGENDPWTLSMYDMEEAFDPEGVMPKLNNGVWDSGTGSLFWDRFLNTFSQQIAARYSQLRGDILSADSTQNQIQNYIGQIPAAYYKADADKNGYPAFDPTDADSMIRSVHGMCGELDSLFNGGV